VWGRTNGPPIIRSECRRLASASAPCHSDASPHPVRSATHAACRSCRRRCSSQQHLVRTTAHAAGGSLTCAASYGEAAFTSTCLGNAMASRAWRGLHGLKTGFGCPARRSDRGDTSTGGDLSCGNIVLCASSFLTCARGPVSRRCSSGVEWGHAAAVSAESCRSCAVILSPSAAAIDDCEG
jgi:hypothetical protein